VRKLKASTKDKSVWQPEVDKLLALKKQLIAAQAHGTNDTPKTGGNNIAELEKAIAEQVYIHTCRRFS
jgi:methionyl-tRNA synthetase